MYHLHSSAKVKKQASLQWLHLTNSSHGQCRTQVSALPSCPPRHPFLRLTSCSTMRTSLLSSYSRLRALTQAALSAWKAPPHHLIQYLAHSRCLGKKEELGILLLEELRACQGDSSRGSKTMSQDFIPVEF